MQSVAEAVDDGVDGEGEVALQGHVHHITLVVVGMGVEER